MSGIAWLRRLRGDMAGFLQTTDGRYVIWVPAWDTHYDWAASDRSQRARILDEALEAFRDFPLPSHVRGMAIVEDFVMDDAKATARRVRAERN